MMVALARRWWPVRSNKEFGVILLMAGSLGGLRVQLDAKGLGDL